MPQLIPFYFNNQTLCVFICIIFIVYLLSKYLMPESFKDAMTRQVYTVTNNQ